MPSKRIFPRPTTDMLADWIREHKNLPNRTSAKLFCAKNPKMGYTVESVRKMIGFIRLPPKVKHVCKNGHVIYNHKNDFQDLIRTKSEIDSWRDKIPKSDPTPYTLHYLPSNVSKWLMLFDLHIPYHDEEAIWTALKHGQKEKCDAVFIDGDFIDMYMMSNFVKDPRNRTLAMELQMARDMLKVIYEVIKPKVFYLKLGNHEDRLRQYILTRSPGLIGLPCADIESLMEYDYSMIKDKEGNDKVKAEHVGNIYNIKYIPAGDPVRWRELTILHGHEFGGGYTMPVNPARGMFLKAGDSVIFGHNHRTSEHIEQRITDKTIGCFSAGCLCNLHPEYAPRNKWNHGFGILTTTSGKYWQFKNYKIIGGKEVV